MVRELADHVDTGRSIAALMSLARRIETATSLAGFEALLRGKDVSVHGQPFYSGWGLTEDLFPVPRRVRKLSLEQLVAGTLILYPRYLDPLCRRPCPPEVVVEMLSRISVARPQLRVRVRSVGGYLLARARFVARRLRGRAFAGGE
jgi:capsular polysaccharide export protein